MQKSLFSTQLWQGPKTGFRGLGAATGVCNAASLEPIPTKIMSALTPPPAAPAPTTLDTLTPTLVVGAAGFLALWAFNIVRF